jgi:hypothetical protein
VKHTRLVTTTLPAEEALRGRERDGVRDGVGEHAGALAAERHAPAGAAAVGCHGAQGREQARCCDAAEHERPNQLRVHASAALCDGGGGGAA